MQNDQTPSPTQISPINQTPSRNKTSFQVSYIIFGIVLFAAGIFIGRGNIKLTGQSYPNQTKLPTSLDYTQLNEIYSTLRSNYNGTLSESQVMDGLKHGLAKSANDPYTEYMSVSEAKDFQTSLQGEITGIGAKLELGADSNIIVQAPLAGSPAESAGLRARDVILTVDGKSTYGMTVNDAVKKIRGEKGTKVTVGVLRGGKDSLTFTITRDVIKIPTAVGKVLDGNVGYLQVSQFSDDTDELVQKTASDFKAKGVTKLILDLRDNPGGEVTTAVNLSSLWLKQNDVVVSQRRGNVTTNTEYATTTNTFQGMKTVVLVNAGSASASEITALALRDHNAATIMGETTYGKGVVQQLFTLSDGGSLKVTIAKWYSPNGTNIDHKGITPDKEVKMTEDDYKNANDPQLKAAQDFLAQ